MTYFQVSAILVVAFSTLQCTSKTIQNNSEKSAEIIFKKENLQKISLEEITRGSRRSVEITNGSKIVELNKTITNAEISSTEWDKIEKEVAKISLEKINSFPSPTTERFHDGAMAATIKITAKSGKLFESQSFDAGKAPKELSVIYKLLSSNFIK